MLLRLRRRVAESTARKWDKETGPYLSIDHLVINFVDKLAGSSIVQEVSINQFGSYVKTPAGFKDFFLDDMEEIRKLSKVSREAKRRAKVNDSSN